MKKFCNSEVRAVTFSGGVASGLQYVFFSENLNNRNNTVENDFFGFRMVKWLHLSVEMEKSVEFFNTPKIIKIG